MLITTAVGLISVIVGFASGALSRWPGTALATAWGLTALGCALWLWSAGKVESTYELFALCLLAGLMGLFCGRAIQGLTSRGKKQDSQMPTAR